MGCRYNRPIWPIIPICFPYDHLGGNFARQRVQGSRSPRQRNEREHRTTPTMNYSQLGYHCFRQIMRSGRKAYADVGRPLGHAT